MSAREDILSNIRRSLGVTGREAPRVSAVQERLRSAPRGVMPARGQVSGAARVALFRSEAERVAASVAEVAQPQDIVSEGARYLREHNLPATLRMGADARLAELDWSETAIEVTHGPSAGDDLNGLSHAFGAIAETGTIVMTSGPGNPTTLNFLPDNHIVVLREADLVGDAESLWDRLRAAYGKAQAPRTVNLITGPSRSGDIEQQIVLGAHGPRRLHIIILRD
jgi:L-lactate dehydrogenase complex protein LldG